jgi:hypothetical protein
MSEANLDTEGSLEWVYLEPEASPSVSITSDVDTDSTEPHGKYDSELDVDMCMADDVDALDSVDIDGYVDMERDGEDAQDEEEEDEKEEEVVDEHEHEHENNGKNPRKIAQGEMVNTSADDVDAVVDDEPTVLLGEGRRCGSIPHGHNLRRLPHRHKPRSLPHDHEVRRLIPSVGWSFWGLRRRKNLAQWRELSEKLRQPETARMEMWSRSYSANRQVATVSTMALSQISLSLMSLSPMSLSQMSLSLRRARMAR